MLKNTNASDEDRAILAGHYIFSSDEFIKLKNEVKNWIGDLDFILKNKVKERTYNDRENKIRNNNGCSPCTRYISYCTFLWMLLSLLHELIDLMKPYCSVGDGDDHDC